MDKKKYAPQLFKAKEVDREEHTIRFVMSTPDVDRHGEVIDQDGWDFKNYMENPVVLWGHDQSIPAVGKVISLEKVGGNTEGVVKFAVEANPLAAMLFELYAEEFMAACSVGFMNTKWQYDENEDMLTLLENELYELSLVNVPANARALAKQKGIDVSPLEQLEKIEKKAALEKSELLGVEKKEVEPEAPAEDTEEEVEEETPEDEVKSAVEVLLKSGTTRIQEAVKELTKATEQKDADTVEPTPAKKQGRKKGEYSMHHVNRVIRSMISVSK